jgi:homocysteine S-methyltransferase
MGTLQDLISDGRAHVFDGAMGTMLYARGVFLNVCYDQLNLEQPGLVQEVHEAYVSAGAEILETNTFGANPVKLSGYGLEDQTEEINQAAVAIARRAADGRACVVGAIGPLGIRIEPWGPTGRDEAEGFFRRQVQGLLAGGVDGFVLETFSDVEELHAALRAVRGLSSLPIVAQMSVGQDGNTAYGTSVEAIAAGLTGSGADVIGLNCSVGPAPMLEAIERMVELTDRPLSAQPNAGLPRAVGDRRIYLASPEYMAQYARRLVRVGVRFVGGCCGTTPEHIRKIREAVGGGALPPSRAPRTAAAPQGSRRGGAGPVVPLAERSEWGRKLASGEFVTSVEILPPRGWDPTQMLEHCASLKKAGIDVASVLDSPRGETRMGAIPAALLIEREAGLETVFHYACRDRNMLGMVSDLLGAAASGLHNILIVTGDPPAPSLDSSSVSDIDSIGLTNVVYRLNQGLDPGGNSIGKPTRFSIGVALNQSAIDLERELERFAWKVDAGAEFAVTQPVFDPAALERCLERVAVREIPIIAGLWPLLSLRNAEFLANEVPGVHIPESVIARMGKAQEQGTERARAEGVLIARQAFDAIRELVQGVHVVAPLGRVSVALDVLEAVVSR